MTDFFEGCSDCKFWEPLTSASYVGECRRYPPQIIEKMLDLAKASSAQDAIDSASRNPITFIDHSCGEFVVASDITLRHRRDRLDRKIEAMQKSAQQAGGPKE